VSIYRKDQIPPHLLECFEPAEIGLEKTPDEFVAAMVEVFGLVRELLADDGVLWLNLGDSYASNPASGGRQSAAMTGGEHKRTPSERLYQRPVGLKPKDLIGIPWRVAFALQEAGWYLRQDIIWHKPNPMPESVTDRCTKAHEYLFLLTKSERYFWDAQAMQERAEHGPPGNKTHRHTTLAEAGDPFFTGKSGLVAYAERQRSKRRQDSTNASAVPGATEHSGLHREGSEREPATRNRRSVWTVPTVPYSGAHFATFPPALIEPCILAGSRTGDVVLDPFGGSGTTAQVAQALGRKWILCELNDAYRPLIDVRVSQPSLDFQQPCDMADTSTSSCSVDLLPAQRQTIGKAGCDAQV